jgi:EAL domain-containing protein (putative c-di-GMP-specific phosphodiesterase class I)
MHVVAEGVEVAGQMDFLKHEGCDEGQGFYITNPLSHDDFVRFIQSYSAENSSQDEAKKIQA